MHLDNSEWCSRDSLAVYPHSMSASRSWRPTSCPCIKRPSVYDIFTRVCAHTHMATFDRWHRDWL